MSKAEEEEIFKKSTETAYEYFKEEMDWEVVINAHEFTTRTNGTEIFLYGYEKGNEDNRISATVDFAEDKYEVQSIGYDEE